MNNAAAKSTEERFARAGSPYPGHFQAGGTGVTNFERDKAAWAEVFRKAAAAVGLGDSIEISHRNMDGANDGCWSLHFKPVPHDLSAFWREVRRLEAAK